MELLSFAAVCFILGGSIGLLVLLRALARPGRPMQLADEERPLISESYIPGQGTGSATSCIVQPGVDAAFSEKAPGETKTKHLDNEQLRVILQDKKRALLKEISAVEASMAELPLASLRVYSPLSNETAGELDLDEIARELFSRVENWHGLDTSRFGRLMHYHHIDVGKDNKAWQHLTCYLFEEMLVCIKERGPVDMMPERKVWTLKGSILIKKHLQDLKTDENTIVLSLSVKELPLFYFRFKTTEERIIWRDLFLDIIGNSTTN